MPLITRFQKIVHKTEGRFYCHALKTEGRFYCHALLSQENRPPVLAETLYKAGGMVAPEPTQYEIDNYYCDSEVDHYWIKKGIEQANKQGYIGLLDLPVDMIFKIL